MNLKTTEAKLYYALYDFFEAEGFRLLMDKKQFRKNTPAGFTNIIFSVSEYEKENDAWVEVHIGCRNEQVEQIAQQFLNSNSVDFRSDANTLIISTGKYNNVNYFRYKIQNDEDLADACESIREFMQSSGFSFLSTINSVSDIDSLLNLLPHKPSKFLYNQVHRCYKGIVAAKLNNSPQLERLTETYRRYLAKFGNEAERHNYERLVAYLNYYGKN
ncbi:hypothetical protein [Runella sp.]|uniref:hypothetical protein n=1 Tax=Runella sp. TaxID=1960881 RepID=UPI003D10AD6B